MSGFSRKEIYLFAWLCAIRTLPFLGVTGNFDYWKDTKEGDKRQKYLLAMLKTLDFLYVVSHTDALDVDVDARAGPHLYVGANNLHSETYNICDYDYDTARADGFANIVARCADTCEDKNYQRKIKVIYYAARVINDAATVIDVDITSARVAIATAAAHAVKNLGIDLSEILMSDLESILSRHYYFRGDIYDSCMDVWNKFEKALHDLGFKYWGNWYNRITANGCTLDKVDYVELQSRLSAPDDVIARDGVAGINRYVLELKTLGDKRLNETRVIILGDKGSGKTSLARRLKNPFALMTNEFESTEGVDLTDWYIPDVTGQFDRGVNVHVWDFAGHVITHAAHPFFMSKRCLYILLIDGRTESGNRIEYWLEQIHNHGGSSPVLVLVNVRDAHRVDIIENTLRNDFPSINFRGFYQANISITGELKIFRQVVMTLLRDNPLWKNQKIYAPEYKVKEILWKKFVKDKLDYIDRKTFTEIAEKNGFPKNKHEQLLEKLRDLGSCIWFDDKELHEQDTMVLNPSWVSYGIYRLINWGLTHEKDTHGVLSISNFNAAFTGKDKNKYDGKERFLFKLMKACKLAFSENSTEIFVPLLLQTDRPKDGIPKFIFGTQLRMECQANHTLPPYTVARLAVVHSKELVIANSWRFGAVLNWKTDTMALVEESAYKRSITVYVSGPHQTEYLSELRETLKLIFKEANCSFPELTYEMLYPVEQQGTAIKPILPEKGILLSEREIVNNVNSKRKLAIGSRGNRQKIDLKLTKEAYDLPYDLQNENNLKESIPRQIGISLLSNLIWVLLGVIGLALLVAVGILHIGWEEIIKYLFGV